MSGIIAVYSLVISVLIAQDLSPPGHESYSLFSYVARFARSRHMLTRRQGIHAPRVWDGGRRDGARSRLLHRHCRRHGRPCLYATVPDLCWHGPDSYFWRSTGPLRVRLGANQNTSELGKLTTTLQPHRCSPPQLAKQGLKLHGGQSGMQLSRRASLTRNTFEPSTDGRVRVCQPHHGTTAFSGHVYPRLRAELNSSPALMHRGLGEGLP